MTTHIRSAEPDCCPESELVGEMLMLANAAALALAALVVGGFMAWLLMGRPLPEWLK